MTVGSTLDWQGIEQAYCTGTESLRQLGKRFGVSGAMISKNARRFRWVRAANYPHAGAPPAAVQVYAPLEEGEPALVADLDHAGRGVRIMAGCLDKLERASRRTKLPREIKVIVEATALAVAAITRMQEVGDIEAGEIDAEIQYELEKLAARKQIIDVEVIESAEPAELDAPEGTADDSL